MIFVTAALAFMEQYRQDFGTEDVPLHLAPGRILAEDVLADRDFPPYHRVTMDGIAICHQAFETGQKTFLIEEIQAAGSPCLELSNELHCIEVMTGTVLPEGCDIVIPYEECTIAGEMASVNINSVRRFQNVHLQGTDSRAGDLLIAKGERISPAVTGILASVGADRVSVQRRPRIAICSTGDELVDIDAMPETHQVRRSNSLMLAAALQEEHIVADVFHLPDDKEVLRSRLAEFLEQYEVLMFSGAVSKGKYDFLPVVLEELGVQTIFHRVAQRPGKPFLFAKAGNGVMIFGFPGNPASTLVCYRVYFRHWLHHSLQYTVPVLSAQLASDVDFKPALSLHLLVRLQISDGILTAIPCAGANSGDMISLAMADAILTLPEGETHFKKGQAFPLRLLKRWS